MNFIIRYQYTLLDTVGNQYAVTPKYFIFYSPVVDFPLIPAENFCVKVLEITNVICSSFFIFVLIGEFQLTGKL